MSASRSDTKCLAGDGREQKFWGMDFEVQVTRPGTHLPTALRKLATFGNGPFLVAGQDSMGTLPGLQCLYILLECWVLELKRSRKLWGPVIVGC